MDGDPPQDADLGFVRQEVPFEENDVESHPGEPQLGPPQRPLERIEGGTVPGVILEDSLQGGFYHDGRFPGLEDVIAHYEGVLKFQLTAAEKGDLLEFLKSL